MTVLANYICISINFIYCKSIFHSTLPKFRFAVLLAAFLCLFPLLGGLHSLIYRPYRS